MESGWYRLTNGEHVYVVGPEVDGDIMVSGYRGAKTAYVKPSQIKEQIVLQEGQCCPFDTDFDGECPWHPKIG